MQYTRAPTNEASEPWLHIPSGVKKSSTPKMPAASKVAMAREATSEACDDAQRFQVRTCMRLYTTTSLALHVIRVQFLYEDYITFIKGNGLGEDIARDAGRSNHIVANRVLLGRLHNGISQHLPGQGTD